VRGSQQNENAVRDLLRGPFFIGSMPCGHDMPSLPASRYGIYTIMGPIVS
jgi:hypothetical protein